MLEYPDGNRFALSTENDRQAGLWIASILSLMYSVVILCTRLVIKWGFFAIDDILLAGAYILSLAHWVVIYLALSHGLGKAPTLLDDHEMQNIGELIFTSRILFLAALGLSKCTVIAFVAQLFTQMNRRAWTSCTVAGSIAAVWTLVAPLAVSIGCHPRKTVGTDASAICPSEALRWKVVVSVDFVLECLLVALPAWLIAAVQMKRNKKSMVILAFAFRFGNALLIIAFLTTYTTTLSSHKLTSIGITEPLIWQEVLTAYALMSATIPVLKGFIGSFDTRALVQIDQSDSGIRSYRYGSAARGISVTGGSVTASGVHDAKSSKKSDRLRLRPENQGIATSIWHDEQREDDSSGRGGSEDVIIHRTVEYEVRSNSTS